MKDKDTTPLPNKLVDAEGHTTCAVCHRAVLVTDIDVDGRCIGCRPPDEEPA